MRAPPDGKPQSSGLTEAARIKQDLAIAGSGLFDLSDLDNIQRSVAGIDGGFHGRWSTALLCRALACRRAMGAQVAEALLLLGVQAR